MSQLVSVVMATYNGQKHLREQLDSILNQTYQNLELIVVDDASVDATLTILDEYAALDKRVTIIPSKINRGVVPTFEHAISLAKGEYIALSDQDDIFHLEKLSTMVKKLEENESSDMAICDLSLINENGDEIAPSMRHYQGLNVKNGNPFSQLLYANFATGCALMFKRRLLQYALPFPPNCYMHDWWLSVVASHSNGGGIVLIDDSLISYRQHASNVLGAHSSGLFAAMRRVNNLEKRTAWYTKNLLRIEGYVTKDFWSVSDKAAMLEAKKLFTYLTSDTSNTFSQRLYSLPLRWKFASKENFVHLLGIILLTFFPKLVDTLRRRID